MKLNREKVGAPYEYPECLMVFLAYLHVLLNIYYRGLEGFLRGLSNGAKVTNRGEWIRQKWTVHRGWIKVHISVDD